MTAQASQFNHASDVRFTIELGVSYTDLGHRDLGGKGAWDCRVRERLGFLLPHPHDKWYRVSLPLSPDDRQRVTSDVAKDWEHHGLPFLRSATEPAELCRHVTELGNPGLVLSVLEQVGLPLGDGALRAALVRKGLDDQAPLAVQRLSDHRIDLSSDLYWYSTMFGHAAAAGVALEPGDRNAAALVLAAARSRLLGTEYADDRARTWADQIAAVVGVPSDG